MMQIIMTDIKVVIDLISNEKQMVTIITICSYQKENQCINIEHQ